MDTALIAALVGAATAAITTWLLDIRRDFAADRRKQREDRALRLAEFLGSTHQSALSIGLLAAEPDETKNGFFTGSFYTASETRESTALNAIQLLDPENVVKACFALHAALVSRERQALAKQWAADEWKTEGTDLGPFVNGVVSAALESLGRPSLDRVALLAEATRQIESGDDQPN